MTEQKNIPSDYQVCNRCGGTGRYSYNLKDGSTCYGCGGKGMTPKLPEKVAKTMNLICKTDNWIKYTFQKGEKLKAKFCNVSEKTGEPIYMVTNKWGMGYKMSITIIEKNCGIGD